MDDPEPIGYVVALPAECRALTRRRSHRGDLLTLGRHHRVAVAGAGSANATAAAEALVAHGARRLVSWGCAGALAADLAPGQLVLPRALVYADGTATDFDSAWHERLQTGLQARIPVCTGTLAESAAIVASATDKRHLHAATGAIATDMETGAVARTAQRLELPCLAIRSIVDTASVTLPGAAQAALDDHGEIVVSQLLRQLVRNPRQIGALLHLSRAFRAAMQTLTLVAAHAGPDLEPH